ncbi:unnamed protein product [Orchesella dallaii]|uniref:Uncharacterized protein n=1 Tax=Orchesella dallaii TaxID=48710 RepID=A0ABP1S3C5_9HEXA
MANGVPEGTKGNGIVKLNTPYGVTPLSLPRIPYVPKTVSLNRTPWEGWRYGSNYVNTDDTEKPYGYPDYTYYRGNYCGPCCSCVPSIAPLGGDPNGKNPNIRYVQLDFKNLLGSGFATQGPPQSQTSPYMMGNPGAATSCGRNHCPECSGVYKKTEQPVKFQVCIGDQSKPETVQPCPAQPMKIYLPLSMLPRGGPDGDKADEDEDESGSCEQGDETEGNENCSNSNTPVLTGSGKQQFEVHIPPQGQAYNQQGNGQCQNFSSNSNSKCVPCKPKGLFDPCGCCKACKTPVPCGPRYGTDITRCQITKT